MFRGLWGNRRVHLSLFLESHPSSRPGTGRMSFRCLPPAKCQAVLRKLHPGFGLPPFMQ